MILLILYWIYLQYESLKAISWFIPHYFNIHFEVGNILKEIGYTEKEIEKFYKDMKKDENIKKYWSDDINYYFKYRLSYNVINHLEWWYLLYDNISNTHSTKVLERIYLNADKSYSSLGIIPSMSKENQDFIKKHKYEHLYVRETIKWYEIWIIKWKLKNQDYVSFWWWTAIFEEEENYKILGIIPYWVIHTNIKTSNEDIKILKDYWLEYTSDYNEYWHYSDSSLSNKYITVNYWSL